MTKKKVVQTDLVEQEYKLLEKVVEKKGLTIKHGLREAVMQWVGTQLPISEDPLFKTKPVRTGVKTDSSKLHRLLYRVEVVEDG